MTKVKIVDIRDRPKLVGPGKRVVDEEIIYVTKKGYTGSVMIPKEAFTEKKLQEVIKKDMEVQERLIGGELEV